MRLFQPPWLSIFLSAALLVAFPRAAASAPLASAGSLAGLREQLRAHISDARFNAALWGVKITSLETGAVLFEDHPARLMSPASNCKLYVAALALDHFGSDYRIRTPIFASVPPDRNGRVAGDMIVSGRGDPSWKSRLRRAGFSAIFAPFVKRLKDAGVRHLTGDIVADATFFQSPAYGAGWVVADLNDDYGAEIAAITLEQNYLELRVTPASIAGRACVFELMHPHAGLVFHNRTVTGAEGGARSIQIQREPGGHIVHVFGSLPVGGAEEIQW